MKLNYLIVIAVAFCFFFTVNRGKAQSVKESREKPVQKSAEVKASTKKIRESSERNTTTPDTSPTPDPVGGCDKCACPTENPCLAPPAKYLPGKKYINSLLTTAQNPVVVVSEITRSPQDKETRISLKISGLDKSIPYYLYAIDEKNRIVKLADINPKNANPVVARTPLSSFILAVSPQNNLKVFDPKNTKFVSIEDARNSFKFTLPWRPPR